MAPTNLFDAIVIGIALAVTISLLGSAFLIILRTPRAQFRLQSLLLTITVIAVAFGSWAAALRSTGMLFMENEDVVTPPASAPEHPANAPREPDSQNSPEPPVPDEQ